MNDENNSYEGNKGICVCHHIISNPTILWHLISKEHLASNLLFKHLKEFLLFHFIVSQSKWHVQTYSLQHLGLKALNRF